MNISLIIPIYNSERFLLRLFKNLEAQEVFFDDHECGEVIFVNDGSTDNSESIILEYKKNHPWVRYIKQENQGQHIARNTGIKAAIGDYVAFMDQDDAYAPNALSLLLDSVINTKGDVVRGRCEMPDDDSYDNWTKQRAEPMSINDCISGVDFIINTHGLKTLLSDTIWGAIYDRKFLLDNNILFEEKCKVHEDGVFNWKVMLAAQKVVLLNNIVYNWIQREDSDFHNQSFEHKLNRKIQRIFLCFFYYRQLIAVRAEDRIPRQIEDILRREMQWELYPYLGFLIKARILTNGEIDPTINRLKEEGVYPYPHRFPKDLPEGYPTSLRYRIMWRLMSYEWILKLMLRLRTRKVPLNLPNKK